MKQASVFLFAIVLIFTACHEIVPPITPIGGGGTGPDDEQPRRVLIEEFTGVQCVQCPEGAEEIETLIGIHGDRLIAVGIHAGHFAIPYPQSNHDFRTQDAFAIFQMLGPVGFYPSAVINRKRFAGENNLVLNKEKWAGYIAQEMMEPSLLGIDINPGWSIGNREISVEVKSNFYQNYTGELLLTVLLLEHNIVDAQLTPQTSSQNPDLGYVHKHVLRKALTNPGGNQIGTGFERGQELTRYFTHSIPQTWNENNISIVAFVSKGGGELETLQVNEAYLIP